MAVSGNLRTMPFPDLMQWISASRKTGTLVIKGQRYTKKILFQTGLVSAVTSNNPREHLGYYLVGWGILTEEEFEHLLDRQKEQNVMLGELLVQTSRLTREQVDHLVRLKTEETIYDLDELERGGVLLPRRRPAAAGTSRSSSSPSTSSSWRAPVRSTSAGTSASSFRTRASIPRVTQSIDETRLTPAGRPCWPRSTARRASRTSPSPAECPSSPS